MGKGTSDSDSLVFFLGIQREILLSNALKHSLQVGDYKEAFRVAKKVSL